ncbi:MAG: PhnD/SsuA/transferrin family substrate-binding protein [Paludibacter sp.]
MYKLHFNSILSSKNIFSNVCISPKATYIITLLLVMILSLPSCKKNVQSAGPKYGDEPAEKLISRYHFAIHPLHNPVMLMRAYQPLLDYLEKNMKGVHFNLETSTDYADFEMKYKKRIPAFILPNPWQTLQAIQSGYNVIATAGDATDFKGLIIVRKDANIKIPSDLKGKSVSYPSQTALAACIMPQYFLYQHGVDVNKDIENHYVGSQESSIMNVFLKMTAASATWPAPWRSFKKRYPKEAAELIVKWETEPLINNSVMVRNDVPKEVWKPVQKHLVHLNGTLEGKEILSTMEISRFIIATNNDYYIVQNYVDKFERDVRKIDQK